MALTQLTKIDGGGISTTSDYRVGVITASKFVGPFEGSAGNFTGVITATGANFSGNVTIGGTLTYEDVTNIDSVGIITAQKDIHVGAGISVVGIVTAATGDFFDLDVDGHTELDNGNVSGVVTFTSAPNAIQMNDGARVSFGTSLKTSISYNASDSRTKIRNYNDTLEIGYRTTELHYINQARLTIAGSNTFSSDAATTFNGTSYHAGWYPSSNGGTFKFNDNARLALGSNGDTNFFHNNSHFYLQNTTGNINVTGNVVLNNDISVDGHTNLDNVSVAGVSTFTGNADFSAGIDVIGGTTSKLNLTNSGSNATEQTATLYTSNSGTHNRIVIKTYTNGGGDPYIKFDAGGQDMIVGSRYAGTTNNLLVLGPGLDPDTTSGIFVKGNGNVGIAEDNPTRKLDVSGDVLGNAFMLRGNTTASPSIQAQMFRPENNTLAFATDGNNERLRIDSSGHVIIANGGYGTADTNADNFVVKTTSSSSSCGLSILSADNQNSTLYFGNASDSKHAEIVWSDAANLFLIGTSNSGASIKFRTANQSDALTIDSSGHLLPGAAGTQNLGSTSKEWGDVYLADGKSVYLGSDQDVRMFYDAAGSASFTIDANAGYTYINSDALRLNSKTSGWNYLRGDKSDGVVKLYKSNSQKLATSDTGITVTGEVTTSQDYPNQRPTLDFNFAKTKALDPRLSYIRSGPASYYDDRGLLVLVGDDTPRFDHDPMTRESKGILLEESRRNMQPHSIQYGSKQSDGWVNIVVQAYVDYNPGVVTPTGDTIGAITFKDIGGTSQHYITTDAITVSSGTTYTFSFFFKSISGSDANNIKVTTGSSVLPFEIRSFYFSGADAGTSTGNDTTLTQLPNGWWRGTYVVTANGNGAAAFYFDLNALNSGAPKNNVMAIYGIQMEIGDFPTSYIPTDANYAIRGGDTLTMTGSDLTDVFNEVEGTMFYEASLESLTRDNQPVVAFRDISSTTSDYHAMGWRIGGSSDSIRTWFRSNSGNEFLSAHSSNGLTTKMFYKHIYGYKLSDCADAYRTATSSGLIDQASATGDGTPMITEGLIDELRFGGYYSLGDTYKLDAGHIKRFSYWTQKLTNTQLTTYIS